MSNNNNNNKNTKLFVLMQIFYVPKSNKMTI
nr:MAG TPA_asm: hypothetical protein [Caudoviricetes sp.]